MQAYQEEIISLFKELLEIPSPSGQEGKMGDFIAKKLNNIACL